MISGEHMVIDYIEKLKEQQRLSHAVRQALKENQQAFSLNNKRYVKKGDAFVQEKPMTAKERLHQRLAENAPRRRR